jgi:hypothetical protein
MGSISPHDLGEAGKIKERIANIIPRPFFRKDEKDSPLAGAAA